MDDNRAHYLPTGEEESRFVKAAADALHADSPNPGRIDCLGLHAVNAVVKRHVTYPEFDDAVDHIATCAECFADYSRLRNRYLFRRASVWGLCVAAILFCLFWTIRPSLLKIWASRGSSTEARAVLDYRAWTVNRSDFTQAPSAEVPTLPRAELEIVIKLPIGTEDGTYRVAVRPLDGRSIIEASGKAVWDGKSESLTIRIDLRHSPPGNCAVEIRSAKGYFRSYPVLLK
jgi:hypothetical protein